MMSDCELDDLLRRNGFASCILYKFNGQNLLFAFHIESFEGVNKLQLLLRNVFQRLIVAWVALGNGKWILFGAMFCELKKHLIKNLQHLSLAQFSWLAETMMRGVHLR